MNADDDKYKFAYALIELRDVHHMTQQQLADRLGFSPQYICDIESGRRMPSVKIVAKIVEKLGPRIGGEAYRRRWNRLGAMAHGWDV